MYFVSLYEMEYSLFVHSLYTACSAVAGLYSGAELLFGNISWRSMGISYWISDVQHLFRGAFMYDGSFHRNVFRMKSGLIISCPPSVMRVRDFDNVHALSLLVR